MGNKVIILGEMHVHKYLDLEVELIPKLIEMGLCDCLLLEDATDQVYDTKEKLEKVIEEYGEVVAVPIYEIALKYNIPIYGHDLPDSFYQKRLSMKEQFKERESRMVNTIEEHRKDKNCVMIVGDTHLRSRRTQQLGPPSPIFRKYVYDPDVYIVRADVMEREADWARNVPYTFTWKEALNGTMFKTKERHNRAHKAMGRIKE